jgi:hypothetical protein
MVHAAFLVPQGITEDPILIGVQGDRSSSPFQIIPQDAITIAVRAWNGTKKANERWTSLTLDQFLALELEDDFENLRAEEGAEITEELDFTRMPRHLFVHPFFFGTLEGKGTSSAKGAATKIIKRLQRIKKEVEPGDEEQIQDFIKGTLLVLAFLWAISRGLIPHIPLSNPPEVDGVDKACNRVLERLQGDEPESPPSKRTKRDSTPKSLIKEKTEGGRGNSPSRYQ